jgi:hypothetical protein
MRQGQRGSLEVVDDSHSLKLKPIPHLVTINRPRAVGKIATLTFHRSRNREHCIFNKPLAKLFLQKILDGVSKLWIACHRDPLDRPKQPIGQQGKSGVCRPDIAQKHGRSGHHLPTRSRMEKTAPQGEPASQTSARIGSIEVGSTTIQRGRQWNQGPGRRRDKAVKGLVGFQKVPVGSSLKSKQRWA